ncbi:MAG: hypothetical protein PHY92_02435 [Alphaproteobacteria bacterium]|nr:hypothetical protein [Alphaproteobacteria bacterium]
MNLAPCILRIYGLIKKRPILTLFAAVVAAIYITQNISSYLQLYKYAEVDTAENFLNTAGRFDGWKDSDNFFVIKSGKRSIYNIKTGQSADAEFNFVKAFSHDIAPENRYFSNQISNNNTHWIRLSHDVHVGGTQLIYPDELGRREERLITPADGAIAMYVHYQQDTTLTDYALIHRKNGRETFLPLIFEKKGTEASGWDFISKRDRVSGNYLFYFHKIRFSSWEKEPSDAWWFNPQNVTIEHITLPNGPWGVNISEGFRCFSCGCDCYHNYDIEVAGGKIFIGITGKDLAIDPVMRGIYELNASRDRWIKRLPSGEDLNQISPGGCYIAIQDDDRVKINNFCES